jgi:hypothetical protein
MISMIKQVNLSHEDMELLSAYLDSALQGKEKALFEVKLLESADLRQTLEIQRQLQRNLRHLPKPKLPHNFILTRAEVQAIKRRKAWAPVFGTASFVSVLLMAMIFILPLFSPAARPAPLSLAMEPSLSPTAAASAEDTFKAQTVPEVSPPAEAVPTEILPAPMAATSRSSEDSVDVFFYGAQAFGKGGGGGSGDGTLDAGGRGGVNDYMVPVAQPAGNLGTFGNAPWGIVIPVEPLFGKNLGVLVPQGYDLEKALAATPSLPPLILGMDTKNAGQVISVQPTLALTTESGAAASMPQATESLSAPAEVPQQSPEPDLAVEAPATSTQVQTRTAQTSTLTTILKVAAGALALFFAGLAFYIKKH